MNIGIIIVRDKIPTVDPIRVSFVALWPSPSSKSSWPGRTDSAVSSDGAPRKMDGMKSRKVWVIAIAVMKINRIVGSSVCVSVKDRTEIEIRLMWIPGIRPEIVPAAIPRRSGIANCIILVFHKKSRCLRHT